MSLSDVFDYDPTGEDWTKPEGPDAEAQISAQVVGAVKLLVQVIADELELTDFEAAKKIRWATYVLYGRDPNSD